MSQDDDELTRYVAHLQTQLAGAGGVTWTHEAYLAWCSRRSEAERKVLESMHGPSVLREFDRAALEFKSQGPHDSFNASGIFGPVLRDIETTARAIGVSTANPVRWANSIASAASPASMPSEHVHLIFAGPGTYAFCNYWGKVVSLLASALNETRPNAQAVTNRADVEKAVRSSPASLDLATRMAAYYATFGTLLGFGVVTHAAELLPIRIEFVRSMELFAIAHEYAHCVIDERIPSMRGVLEPSAAIKLELDCDRLAVALVQAHGASSNNWTAFTSTGAIMLLTFAELCTTAADLLGQKTVQAHDHPPSTQRIASLVELTLSKIPDDQRRSAASYIADMRAMCDVLCELVREILSAVGQTTLESGTSG